VIHPAIHSNGTSKDVLCRQLSDATYALRKALIAMKNTQPNGRDYYTLGNYAINVAGLDHQARLKAVVGVLSEYEEMLDHLMNTTEKSRR